MYGGNNIPPPPFQDPYYPTGQGGSMGFGQHESQYPGSNFPAAYGGQQPQVQGNFYLRSGPGQMPGGYVPNPGPGAYMPGQNYPMPGGYGAAGQMPGAYQPGPMPGAYQPGPVPSQSYGTHSSGLPGALAAGMSALSSGGHSSGGSKTGKTGKMDMAMGLASAVLNNPQAPPPPHGGQPHQNPGSGHASHTSTTGSLIGAVAQSGGSKSAMAKGLAHQMMHKPH